MLFEPCVRFHIFISIRVTEWPPIGKLLLTLLTMCFLNIRTLLSINCFPTSFFWSENFFLIAPFPDHCLLVPIYTVYFPKLTY